MQVNSRHPVQRHGGGTVRIRRMLVASVLAFLWTGAAEAATLTTCFGITQSFLFPVPLNLNWSSSASWDCGKTPNNTANQLFGVAIPSSDTMNLDVAATIGQGGGEPLNVEGALRLGQALTISGGGTVTVAGSISFTSNSPIPGSTGSLTLAGAASSTLTLASSSGSVSMNSPLAVIQAAGANNQTLVNDIRISGEGIIGNGTRLVLKNVGSIEAGGDLTLNGAPVVAAGQPTILNSGGLYADGGAVLRITGQTVENSGGAGTLLALHTGTIVLSSTTVLDGNITVAGTLILDGAVLQHSQSTLGITNSGTILTGAGGGVINFGAGDSLSNVGSIQATTGPLTISGGGQTIFNQGLIEAKRRHAGSPEWKLPGRRLSGGKRNATAERRIPRRGQKRPVPGERGGGRYA